MAMTVVIFGRFPSCGEGDVLSSGEGSRAFRAGDGGGAGCEVISCGNRDIPVGVNFCAEFRAAFGAQVVFRILRHVLSSLNSFFNP